MPNWCENWLHVSGDEKDVDAFVKAVASSDPEQGVLSFGALLPVPKRLLDVSAEDDACGVGDDYLCPDCYSAAA